jgi:hypothetical protein
MPKVEVSIKMVVERSTGITDEEIHEAFDEELPGLILYQDARAVRKATIEEVTEVIVG